MVTLHKFNTEAEAAQYGFNHKHLGWSMSTPWFNELSGYWCLTVIK